MENITVLMIGIILFKENHQEELKDWVNWKKPFYKQPFKKIRWVHVSNWVWIFNCGSLAEFWETISSFCSRIVHSSIFCSRTVHYVVLWVDRRPSKINQQNNIYIVSHVSQLSTLSLFTAHACLKSPYDKNNVFLYIFLWEKPIVIQIILFLQF